MPGRRGELKYLDVSGAPQTFTSAGTLVLLNGLVPGTGASQRIGKKIVTKSLLFRGSIGSGDTGGTPFRGMVRLLWIYDKQSNATAPTVAQILESVAAYSPMNMDNRDRFVVLRDKQYAIDQSGGNQSAQVKLYKRLMIPTIYNAGVAGTVADITSGSIYLLLIGESAGATVPTNQPIIDFTNRIRYDDS